MSDFLSQMRGRVLERVKSIQPESMRERNDIINFCGLFAEKTCLNVIAEVKLESPSKGLLYRGLLSPVDIALSYMQHGARAISVLTEPYFFRGNIQTVADLHRACPDCPILLKDFVLSPIQILQAYLAGASAVLLIVGFLPKSLLHDLYAYASDLGLAILLEVHSEAELQQALELNPKMIGINHRDLATLAIDMDVSQRLCPLIPEHVMVIGESGISSSQILLEKQALFDGFLIGSHLMKTIHPGLALRDLLQGASYAR